MNLLSTVMKIRTNLLQNLSLNLKSKCLFIYFGSESTNKDIKYELNNQEILENLPKRINDNLNHRPESIKIKKNECDINEEQGI